MCLILCGPTIPQKACGDEKCADEERRQSVLRFEDPTGGSHFLQVIVGKCADADLTGNETDAETQICKASLEGGETVLIFKDAGEGGKQWVEIAVDDCHVDRDEGDDR